MRQARRDPDDDGDHAPGDHARDASRNGKPGQFLLKLLVEFLSNVSNAGFDVGDLCAYMDVCTVPGERMSTQLWPYAKSKQPSATATATMRQPQEGPDIDAFNTFPCTHERWDRR